VIADVRTILLAEDNSNDVELTLAALRENNLVNPVVVARDGSEALDYLQCRNEHAERIGGNPALFLLDLKMPKVDGIELMLAVKAVPRFKSIPFVVLTSSREERELVNSYNLGVNAYVVKPVAFQDFVHAVRLLGGFWAVLNEPPPPRAA
jgi:CheY-like chemotaxis protein